MRRWRILLVFGVFEFSVPLLGIWLGGRAAERLADRAPWLSSALLAAVGIWTMVAAWRSSADPRRYARHAASWGGLVVLAGLLSVDNLVVGFGIGLGGASPLLLAATIACFAIGFAALGLRIGHRARRHHERAAETFAGAVLVVLAVAIAAGWL